MVVRQRKYVSLPPSLSSFNLCKGAPSLMGWLVHILSSHYNVNIVKVLGTLITCPCTQCIPTRFVAIATYTTEEGFAPIPSIGPNRDELSFPFALFANWCLIARKSVYLECKWGYTKALFYFLIVYLCSGAAMCHRLVAFRLGTHYP